MSDTNNDQASWMRTVAREAGVRRGLIIDGHVRDIFHDPSQREYVLLAELLARVLLRDSAPGFTLVGQWDHVDGLRFSDARMLQRFQEVIRPNAGSKKPASGQAYDVGETPAQTTPAGLYTNPGELMPALRRAMAVPNERPVFILNWNHYLIGQASHLASEEREWMLHLGKAMCGEPIVPMDSDHLRRGNGLVIVLTANLSTLPPLLYQDEARIRLITVPAPDRAERCAFFGRHGDDLRCERPRSPSGDARIVGREEIAGIFADLTDHASRVDLRQILSLSLRTDPPLAPDRLLNLYRFGDQRSPWEELGDEKLAGIEPFLRERVIGQDQAVEHVATNVIRAQMGLAGLQHSLHHTTPKGKMFFVGPTGVGKTELAKALTEFLFGDQSAFIRFDMSEYNHEHSDQRLVGAPPGYVGFEEGGQLTNAVRERPFCVLLFDEIEKAHPRILDKFLQVLEDGRLTDGRGQTAFFKECIIIFTSNLGASDMPESNDPPVIREHFVRAVEDHFVRQLGRPELLNRLGDNIVVFNPITDDGFRRAILIRKIQPLQQTLQERFGTPLHVGEELEQHYLQAARSDHGGRGVVNALERDLLNPLARFLFSHRHQLRRGRAIYAQLQAGRTAFEIREA